MRDGGVVFLESGYGADVEAALTALGHLTAPDKSGYGGYQAIHWDNKRRVYHGASESRKDGNAAGY